MFNEFEQKSMSYQKARLFYSLKLNYPKTKWANFFGMLISVQ